MLFSCYPKAKAIQVVFVNKIIVLLLVIKALRLAHPQEPASFVRAASCGLRAAGCGLRAAGCGLRAVGCGR